MKSLRFAAFAAIPLLSGCGGQPGQQGEPPGLQVLALEITGEIGVELGDSNYVFGHVADLVRTDSLLYVLDMARAHISLYDNNGRFAGTIGRRGSGPGEFASPRNLLLSPRGILVQDINGLKLLEMDGSWKRFILEHQGNWPGQNKLVDDSTFCVVWHDFQTSGVPFIRPFVGVFDFQGDPVCELWADSIRIPVPPENNNHALNAWRFGHYLASDGQGGIFHHRRHSGEYLIRRFDRNGGLLGEISRQYTAVVKTPEEILLEKEYIEDMLRGSGTTNVMQWVYEPDPFREPISGLWVSGDGNLWVLLGTEPRPTFDVWSLPDGVLKYRAELSLDIPRGEFLTFFISPHSRRFAAVHEDEGMVQRILLIEVERPQED